jgi:hypothetical protein
MVQKAFKDSAELLRFLTSLDGGSYGYHSEPIMTEEHHPISWTDIGGGCHSRLERTITTSNSENARIAMMPWRVSYPVKTERDQVLVFDKTDAVLSAECIEEAIAMMRNVKINEVPLKSFHEDKITGIDGKYDFVDTQAGLDVLRYGEKWLSAREFVNVNGSNAFYSLYFKAKDLERKVIVLTNIVNKLRGFKNVNA